MGLAVMWANFWLLDLLAGVLCFNYTLYRCTLMMEAMPLLNTSGPRR